ncbi:MAG: mismatch-specific DNA-glycosylase, partial [Candidatus Latescibacterota bacterium]
MAKPPSRRSASAGRSAPLPDHVQPGLRLLFVGINPGLRSAATGHHYAGHSNRFWKLLYDSGLVPEPLTAARDAE